MSHWMNFVLVVTAIVVFLVMMFLLRQRYQFSEDNEGLTRFLYAPWRKWRIAIQGLRFFLFPLSILCFTALLLLTGAATVEDLFSDPEDLKFSLVFLPAIMFILWFCTRGVWRGVQEIKKKADLMNGWIAESQYDGAWKIWKRDSDEAFSQTFTKGTVHLGKLGICATAIMPGQLSIQYPVLIPYDKIGHVQPVRQSMANKALTGISVAGSLLSLFSGTFMSMGITTLTPGLIVTDVHGNEYGLLCVHAEACLKLLREKL